MTVYVDNAFIEATVPNGSRRHSSRWCHMTADTQEELHAFAQLIGLRREWFQIPKFAGKPSNPESRGGQNWHYDLTASKRRLAVARGAVDCSREEFSAAIERRFERDYPEAYRAWKDNLNTLRAQWIAKHGGGAQ